MLERIEIILNDGAERPFAPFDRFAFREEYKGDRLAELLDRFRELRSRNLERLRSLELGSEQLELEGRHPELGTVRLRQLLASWAVHDLGHIRQIVRVMAKQYTDEVGPWKPYLRVLGE